MKKIIETKYERKKLKDLYEKDFYKELEESFNNPLNWSTANDCIHGECELCCEECGIK